VGCEVDECVVTATFFPTKQKITEGDSQIALFALVLKILPTFM
jgi:hypothetical protein